jgi:hypothetical protein
LSGNIDETRNTRSVLPIRLSDRERAQIAGAAQRRELTVSGFVRQAALAASAVVQGKVTPRIENAEISLRRGQPSSDPKKPNRDGLVFVDTELPGHWVDGERVA